MKIQDILYNQRIIAKEFKDQWIQSMSLDLKDYLNKYTKQDLITKIPELFQPGRYYNLLNKLWTKGFNLGDSLNNKPTTFSLSDSLLDLVNFAEKDTRRRKMKGEYIASSQGIETTDFGKLYLKYRNQEIFNNFIPQYRQTIKASIKKYVESPKPDESALYNALKPQYIRDKTPKELTDYVKVKSTDKEFMDSQGLQVNDMAGLLKKIKENPDIYDKTGYYLDLDNRVDRIAQTEVSQAYNLGVIAKSVQKGNTLFMWNNSLESTLTKCKLCASLFGKIIDLGSSVIGSYQGWNMDFKKLPSGYTRRTIFELPQIQNNIAPLAHPSCYCSLTVLDSKEVVTKYYSAITGNRANNKELLNKVLSSVGMQNEEQKIKEDKSLVKNLLSAALIGTVAVKGVDVAKQLSYDLVLEHKKKEEQRRKQKMIIIGSSILATGMMMYFLYKTNAKLKTNILDDIVEEIVPTEKLSAKAARSINAGIEVAKETADELAEAIVDEIAEEFTEGVEESMEKLELEALYHSTLRSLKNATSVLQSIYTNANKYINSTKTYLTKWNTLVRKIRTDKFDNLTRLEDNFNFKNISLDIVNEYVRNYPSNYLERLSKLRGRITDYKSELLYIEERLKNLDFNIKVDRDKVVDRDTFIHNKMMEVREKLSEGSEKDKSNLVIIEREYNNYIAVRKLLDNTYKSMVKYVQNRLSIFKVIKAAETIDLDSLYLTDKILYESLDKAFDQLKVTKTES